MMATSKSQGKSHKRANRNRTTRSQNILREWRGCDEPANLTEGVHDAADFLEEILQSAGADTGIREERLREMWKEIAGDFISMHTELVSIRHAELLLRVSQPALRFQLERMKPELLSRIRENLGESIKSIRFTHG